MSNILDMNVCKITDDADPVAEQDVVTKSYLHTMEGGIQKCWVVYGNPLPSITNREIGIVALPIGKNISNG